MSAFSLCCTQLLRLLHTSELGVALLHVTQALDEHLDGNVLVVRVEMALRRVARKVDERVGVRGDTRETGKNVAES